MDTRLTSSIRDLPFTLQGDSQWATKGFCINGSRVTVEYATVGGTFDYMNVYLKKDNGASADSAIGVDGNGTLSLKGTSGQCFYLDIDPDDVTWSVTVRE